MSSFIPPKGDGSALTGAEIKTAYESQPDTNAFTDAEKDTLSSLGGRKIFEDVKALLVTDVRGYEAYSVGETVEAGEHTFTVAPQGAAVTDGYPLVNSGGVKFYVNKKAGSYHLGAFGDFSGAATGSRDNDAVIAAIYAAQGDALTLENGPYDFDATLSGLDDVHIIGTPFTNFLSKALPMFNGVYTGNTQVAIVSAVVRFYDSSENLGSGYVEGETCQVVPFSGAASGATCTVTVGGGAKGVATISGIVEGGAGYTANQQCRLVGANGVGCQVVATVSGGAVTALTKVSGWYLLRDGQESHDPVLMEEVQVSGGSSIIMGVGLNALGLNENMWTPSGFLVGPDEDLARQGVTAGASVGMRTVGIEASSGADEAASIAYDGTAWGGGNAGLYDISWVAGSNAYLQLDRKATYTRGNCGGLKPFIPIPKVDAGDQPFDIKGGSLTADGMRVSFFDENNARMTTENTRMKFHIIDPYMMPKVFDWGSAPPRGGNFWMFGMYVKRPASYP
jgi:hypothetical protein|tara:strand:- start:2649 stop:4169 length:1521 start_codon:yes stop_codon:yes gene_type:complete